MNDDELEDIELLDDDEFGDTPVIYRMDDYRRRDESGHQRYSRSDASTAGCKTDVKQSE